MVQMVKKPAQFVSISKLSTFPDLSFMPTGGVTPDNVATYLMLESVCAVGGSWLTPRGLLVHKRWDELCKLAGDSVAKVIQVSEERST